MRVLRHDGTARIKIIQPGQGASGYYPKDVLERDGPKVFRRGLQMFWDHPTSQEDATRPERSLRDLAGELASDAVWEEAGPAGPGLYADVQVFGPYREALGEIAASIGVSIRAMGKARMGTIEGRKVSIIETLVAAKSVDFVTKPGAGGKVLQLLEAARNDTSGPAKPSSGGIPAKEDPMPLTEAEQARITSLEESATALTATVKDLAEANRVLVRQALCSEARTQAGAILAGINLPAPSRARLAESLGATPPLKDGALDRVAFDLAVREAAKAEGQYIADLMPGQGGVTGMGETLQESAGEALKPEVITARLTEAFKDLDMTDSMAASAAQGRV